jgi:ectoine hydroxylase-related dioxygenase (phytanoyl-CoA dioxygenase family)
MPTPKPQIDRQLVARTVDTIRDVGFCVVPDMLPRQLCRDVHAVLGKLMRAEKSVNLQPSRHQRVMHLLAKDPVFVPVLCSPFVLAVWRAYLGPDMICSTMSANVLWPHSTELYWHVDHPFWTMAQPYPVYPLAGQAIWMIDDFTEANGATAGIAGSHRRPYLPALGEHWTDEATILTGSSCSVILADGAWWHTSRPNVTGRSRQAVLATYIRSYCVTQEDMRFQLQTMKRPSRLVKQLLGGNLYQARTELPY